VINYFFEKIVVLNKQPAQANTNKTPFGRQPIFDMVI
jgi:hypothetical protein